MKRFASMILLAAVATLALACATSATVSEAAAGTDSPKIGSATHYRLLSDPKAIREIDWARPPLDLHVKGVMSSKGFEPIGGVAGRGRLCAEGRDFVTLRDGVFHEAGSAQPESPWIAGCKSRTGGFVPATREIS